MAFNLATWRLFRRWSRVFLIVSLFVEALTFSALADRSTFRTYNADQNLLSLGGACMTQDHAGYLLVCTEHGVFAYDGRRFVNLGADQGLRQGGLVFDLAVASSGRVAVGFANQLMVSDRASDSTHPPTSLLFKPILLPGINFFDERSHRLTAWQGGFVFLAGNATVRIAVADTGDPKAEIMGYNREEERLLDSASAVFSVGRHLWETFADGRICAADPGAVRCYGEQDGLRGGQWWDIVADGDQRLVARSESTVATLDLRSGHWSVADLPDQGGRYVNFNPHLGLFRTPDGGLVTQANHGLAVRGAKGWRLLSVEEGAPSGTIVSSITDASGQLWFQVLGRGLVRWLGYGHWETVQKSEGLSDGFAWKAVRAPGGPLWVATDTGVDAVTRVGSSLSVTKILPPASFALAIGSRGELWRGYKNVGVRVLDTATGSVRSLDTPPVNVIVAAPDETVWLGTQEGLFRVDDHRGALLRPVLEGSPRSVVIDIVCDRKGGVYYLSNGRLRHRRPDGIDAAISGEWPAEGFDPLALALDHKGDLWVGGAGGLYHLVVSDDRAVSAEQIPTANTRTNSIVAVIVDHRGWIWAGTASGVSAFDGRRWVSVNTDRGLISDDVDENGLTEDPDGSIWITTTQGLSHLLDPDWLFINRTVTAVVSGAFLGSRKIVGGAMPYTRDALSVQFGTPDGGSEKSFVFRYNLSGVDAGWDESSTGLVRYPYVPAGHHVLTVVGYDQLTHGVSAPATLEINVAYPWWRQWWWEAIWALCAAGLVYGAMHMRFRVMLARQAELKRHVSQATEKFQYLATHDVLTGLLNRSEIETRLATKLSSGQGDVEMIIALIDIDHFKRVNDEYGHLGGDDVLRAVGHLVEKSLCEGDYAGRYGGEEILLVLSDADGRGAERVLELHHLLRGTSFAAAGRTIRLTCSIGVAWACRGDNWESLIARADDALYKAKSAGRDLVVESGRNVSAPDGLNHGRRLRQRGL